MATTINASTSSGLVNSADTSGTLELQSNGTTKVAVSSTGVALTGASMTSFAGGAITQATKIDSTSGTSIEFTNIPSWVKRITIMLSGVSTNSTGLPQVQLGTGSTTYTITGYLGSCLSLGAAGNGAANNSTGFIFGTALTAASTSVRHGNIVLTNLNSNTWTISGNVASSEAALLAVSGGSIALASALTAVRIIASATGSPSDTFDAGSINILYEG